MLLSLIHYFKYVFVVCFAFLFLSFEVLSIPLCAKKDKEVSSLFLEEVKKRFHKEMDEHYSRFVETGSLYEVEKEYYLEKYADPFIEVYSNPNNKSQKIVYIEYNKDWWGSLYFVVFKDQQFLQWTEIELFKVTVTCVQWNEEDFFYQHSIYQEAVKKNTCFFKNDSIQCEKEN